MKSESIARKCIAFIGLDRSEIPAFARWRIEMQNMMNWMHGLLFHKSCGSRIHFLIAMDYLCGTRAVNYLHQLKEMGEGWENLTLELDTVFGLGKEKGNRRDKKTYYEMRERWPEKRFIGREKRDEYLLACCDELILVANEKHGRKEEMANRAAAMGKPVNWITPDMPMIGERMFEGMRRERIWKKLEQ